MIKLIIGTMALTFFNKLTYLATKVNYLAYDAESNQDRLKPVIRFLVFWDLLWVSWGIVFGSLIALELRNFSLVMTSFGILALLIYKLFASKVYYQIDMISAMSKNKIIPPKQRIIYFFISMLLYFGSFLLCFVLVKVIANI